MSAQRSSGLRTRPASWLTVFGLIFVLSWSGNQFTPLLLLYKQQEHYSSLAVNAFLGVYVLGLAPSLLLTGALSDRYGRRPMMIVGVVAAITGSTALACGVLGTAPLYVGRLLAGVAVGVAMAVGTSWLKEVSQAPHDLAADFGAGARRASLGFTLGSGAGALMAGSIAQWTPFGTWLPYLINIALAVPFLWLTLRVPETSVSGGERGPLLEQFRIPAAGHKRFVRVVVVMAPWLFVAASLGYGYLPVLLSGPSTGFGVAYATLLCVIMLGTSALIQPIAKRLDSESSARSLLIGFGVMVVGLLGVVIADHFQSLLLGALVAFVLGAGFGIGLLSSLLEVQRIATPRDLAGLTGLFYAIAYTGFLAPAVLAAATTWFATEDLLVAVAVVAVVGVVLVLFSNRKHLPGSGTVGK